MGGWLQQQVSNVSGGLSDFVSNPLGTLGDFYETSGLQNLVHSLGKGVDELIPTETLQKYKDAMSMQELARMGWVPQANANALLQSAKDSVQSIVDAHRAVANTALDVTNPDLSNVFQDGYLGHAADVLNTERENLQGFVSGDQSVGETAAGTYLDNIAVAVATGGNPYAVGAYTSAEGKYAKDQSDFDALRAGATAAGTAYAAGELGDYMNTPNNVGSPTSEVPVESTINTTVGNSTGGVDNVNWIPNDDGTFTNAATGQVYNYDGQWQPALDTSGGVEVPLSNGGTYNTATGEVTTAGGNSYTPAHGTGGVASTGLTASSAGSTSSVYPSLNNPAGWGIGLGALYGAYQSGENASNANKNTANIANAISRNNAYYDTKLQESYDSPLGYLGTTEGQALSRNAYNSTMAGASAAGLRLNPVQTRMSLNDALFKNVDQYRNTLNKQRYDYSGALNANRDMYTAAQNATNATTGAIGTGAALAANTNWGQLGTSFNNNTNNWFSNSNNNNQWGP